MVLRVLLLGTHYRQPINLIEDSLSQAQKVWSTLNKAYHLAQEVKNDSGVNEEVIDIDIFKSAMNDDLNSAIALSILLNISKGISNPIIANTYIELFQVLGLKEEGIEQQVITEEQQVLIDRREEARKVKDWVLADRLRDELIAQGLTISDKAIN